MLQVGVSHSLTVLVFSSDDIDVTSVKAKPTSWQTCTTEYTWQLSKPAEIFVVGVFHGIAAERLYLQDSLKWFDSCDVTECLTEQLAPWTFLPLIN